MNKSLLELNAESFDEALLSIDGALAHVEGSCQLMRQKAQIHRSRGDEEAEEAVLIEAARSTNGNMGDYRSIGWRLIQLGSGAGALEAFGMLSAHLKKENTFETDEDFLAGLCIALWINEEKEQAMSGFLGLLKAGAEADPKTDWGDPQTITNQKWEEIEKAPLRELRDEVFRQHPDWLNAKEPEPDR